MSHKSTDKLHEVKNHLKRREKARRVRNVFGEDGVSDEVAQFWFHQFKTNNECIEDKQHQGHSETYTNI